jgi:hypothetical protein
VYYIEKYDGFQIAYGQPMDLGGGHPWGSPRTGMKVDLLPFGFLADASGRLKFGGGPGSKAV